MLIITVRGSW